MPITTSYVCSKCKKEVKSPELYILTIMVKPSIGPSYGTGKSSRAVMHACITCMKKMGINEPDSAVSHVIHAPSIEDLITEIAVNAVRDD